VQQKGWYALGVARSLRCASRSLRCDDDDLVTDVVDDASDCLDDANNEASVIPGTIHYVRENAPGCGSTDASKIQSLPSERTTARQSTKWHGSHPKS
jgi:hypothetical protein